MPVMNFAFSRDVPAKAGLGPDDMECLDQTCFIRAEAFSSAHPARRGA